MNRIEFIKTITLLPLIGTVMKLNELNKIAESFESTKTMPVLFMGHGNPMNAIQENEFVNGWRKMGENIPKPNAIICISAHWETRGTKVTAMEKPKTIHDFGGFPQELFDVEYPAPGSPEWAKETKKVIKSTEVNLDHIWGLDHGTWSVVKHLYPKADIPVIQLSLDIYKTPQEHYEMSKELNQLRKKGVLIIGSGNMVHNLRMMDWKNINTPNYGFDWAIEANEKMKEFIISGNNNELIKFDKQGKAFNLSIPTPEHYLPLLYITALRNNNEEVTFYNDTAVAGSLTMTSFKIQ